MSRKARITIPGAMQHIMSRGIEGCRIFRDDNDRRVSNDTVESIHNTVCLVIEDVSLV